MRFIICIRCVLGWRARRDDRITMPGSVMAVESDVKGIRVIHKDASEPVMMKTNGM